MFFMRYVTSGHVHQCFSLRASVQERSDTVIMDTKIGYLVCFGCYLVL